MRFFSFPLRGCDHYKYYKIKYTLSIYCNAYINIKYEKIFD